MHEAKPSMGSRPGTRRSISSSRFARAAARGIQDERIFGFAGKVPAPEEARVTAGEWERVRFAPAVIERRQAGLLPPRSHGLGEEELASELEAESGFDRDAPIENARDETQV